MKKLYLLTVGALVNDPLIKWMTENFIYSKIHEYFDVVWIITVPNEKRKQDCLFQTHDAPFKVNILVDPLSRTDRVEAMRQTLLKMPINSLIWSIPEGAIVNSNAGIFLKNTINDNYQNIIPEGSLCKGIDHIIFYRPPDGLLNDKINTENFFNQNRQQNTNIFISLDDLYLMRGAKTELERACVIYWALKYHQHFYTNIYEPVFSQIRDKTFSLLEIGIAQGASLRAFRDYLPNVNVIGLDNYPESFIKENRIDSFIGDSTSEETVNNILSINNQNKFHIIIDDGNHDPHFQFETFKKFWPILEKNGIYFIEDVYGIEQLEENIKNYNPNLKIIREDLRPVSGGWDSVILRISEQ